VQLILKAVFFDFADTLVHTDGFDYDACLKKMQQNLTKNGLAVPSEDFIRAYFHARDRFYKKTSETLEEQEFEERMREALKICGITLMPQDKRVHEAIDVFMDAFVDSMKMDDYVVSLLEQLQRKYKLAIVSNMSYADAELRSLKKLGIAEYFDAVVISGKVGWRKPSSRIFQEALKAVDVKAVETVFVGDSPIADVEGAQQIGMKTILLVEKNRKVPITDTSQFYANRNVETIIPDKTITELTQLPEALDFLTRQTEP
jgi:putative hydrolase of the HAD superfamily